MLKFPDQKLEVISPKKDIRYYLNGIFYDAEVKAFIVTDGHCMVKLPVTFVEVGVEPDVSAIIPIDFWNDMRRRKVLGFSLSVLTTDGIATVTDSDGRMCKCIGGKYPDWTRVFIDPEKRNKYVVSFNAALLANLAKCCGTDGVVRLRFGEDRDSIVVDGASECTGILMPCRL